MPRTLKPAAYVCSACAAAVDTWSGRCPRCGEWNTLEIQTLMPGAVRSGRLKSTPLSGGLATDAKRFSSKLPAVDKVFGGGIVAGSVSLLSGDPGMGKSTLLLQLAAGVAADHSVLYVSGEESLHQVAARAERLKLAAKHLKIAATTSADDISAEILGGGHQLVIVDSIQTVACADVGSMAGSVAQVTNASALLAQAAKQSNAAVVLVGHVTKEGNLAGPKLLEHVVDVVLSLEGDPSGGLKLLRVNKNRFGSTNETAIFEMGASGLRAVANPSALLLAERQATDGSVVLAAIEGSRPLLVEVQALVNPTSYGYPKRAASGYDLSRLNLLLAVLERRTTLKLGDKDIYLNLVGGLKISEPAADLAVVMAVASAARGKQLKLNAVVFGEVGLSGEVRHVPFIGRRVTEARQLGFDYAIGPNPPDTKAQAQLKPVSDVKTALNSFLA